MPQALRDVFCMQGGGLNVEGVNSWKKRKKLCEQSRNLVVSAKSQNIPDICHEHHERRLCKNFLAGVNFYRFNAKNWQFTL